MHTGVFAGDGLQKRRHCGCDSLVFMCLVHNGLILASTLIILSAPSGRAGPVSGAGLKSAGLVLCLFSAWQIHLGARLSRHSKGGGDSNCTSTAADWLFWPPLPPQAPPPVGNYILLHLSFKHCIPCSGRASFKKKKDRFLLGWCFLSFAFEAYICFLVKLPNFSRSVFYIYKY